MSTFTSLYKHLSNIKSLSDKRSEIVRDHNRDWDYLESQRHTFESRREYNTERWQLQNIHNIELGDIDTNIRKNFHEYLVYLEPIGTIANLLTYLISTAAFIIYKIRFGIKMSNKNIISDILIFFLTGWLFYIFLIVDVLHTKTQYTILYLIIGPILYFIVKGIAYDVNKKMKIDPGDLYIFAFEFALKIFQLYALGIFQIQYFIKTNPRFRFR